MLLLYHTSSSTDGALVPQVISHQIAEGLASFKGLHPLLYIPKNHLRASNPPKFCTAATHSVMEPKVNIIAGRTTRSVNLDHYPQERRCEHIMNENCAQDQIVLIRADYSKVLLERVRFRIAEIR